MPEAPEASPDPGSPPPSRFRRHLRFSFGPAMPKIELALERLRELVTTAT